MEWTPYIEYAMRVWHIESVNISKKKKINDQDKVITFCLNFYMPIKSPNKINTNFIHNETVF